MRKIVALALTLFLAIPMAFSQVRNNTADGILGDYSSTYGDDSYKVHVTKKKDGTYKAQIFWVNHPVDEKGNKVLDVKNPDKSLRTVPCDQVVLIDGLKYDASKKEWSDAKIYDPTRGIKVNVTCKFGQDGKLALRGSVMGIGQTVYWEEIKK